MLTLQRSVRQKITCTNKLTGQQVVLTMLGNTSIFTVLDVDGEQWAMTFGAVRTIAVEPPIQIGIYGLRHQSAKIGIEASRVWEIVRDELLTRSPHTAPLDPIDGGPQGEPVLGGTISTKGGEPC